jgi:hypothetical protein
LISTGNTDVTVSFTVTPLHAELGSINYYVPYNVTLGSHPSGSVGVVTTLATGGIIFSQTTPDTSVLSNAVAEVLTADGAGRKWTSVPVEVTFYTEANIAYELPEGDYTSTITANIVVDS